MKQIIGSTGAFKKRKGKRSYPAAGGGCWKQGAFALEALLKKDSSIVATTFQRI